MLACKEEAGTLQRGVTIIIRPTPTEIADAIWNLSDKEQIVLLGCLKRRFCNRGEGLLQMAAVANELDKAPEEKIKEVKDFVTVLANYILGNTVNESLRQRNAELAGQKASLERWLGEAKAIIKELIYADGRFADSYPKLINKAEQFLRWS